jgi:hypothetical protein
MRHLMFALLVVVSSSGCKKAGGGGGDDQAPDATTPGGTSYPLTWGPVTATANEENTECIIVNLGNPDPIKVHEIHNQLTNGSHHLIIYKDDKDTVEQTTPMPCAPFQGALNPSGMIAPLVITQKQDDDVVLPDGVAYTFNANQMIKVELHFINTGDTSEDISANINFVAADAASVHDEASVMFAGSPDITIPANSMFQLHEFLTIPSDLDFSTSHIFAVTGHEHQYGTGVQVNVAPSTTGTLTSVYDPSVFTWSEPATQMQDPDFAIPKGGGFDFTCNWYNSSSAEVDFGESANNEMCFFWLYYWPSQGSKVCIHTTQAGGANGTDLCCPDPNDTSGFCAYLDSAF